MRRAVTILALTLGLAATAGAGAANRQTAEPRKIHVTASKFAFEPSRIEMKVGETVELTLDSADAKHGFECKDLNVTKVTFEKDKPVVVTITATKAGTFEFKCASFCGSGHRRMKGQIAVSPA